MWISWKPILNLLCVFILGLNAFIFSGCSYQGPVNAEGKGATAVGGLSNVNVNVSPSIALGDEVAESASKAALAYLAGFSTPTTSAAIDQATRRGVQTGIHKAEGQEQKVTPEKRDELERYVRQAITNFLAEHARR